MKKASASAKKKAATSIKPPRKQDRSWFILITCFMALVAGFVIMNVSNISSDRVPLLVGLLAIVLSLSLYLFKGVY